MSKGIQIKIILVPYVPKPEKYPVGASIEQMAAIDCSSLSRHIRTSIIGHDWQSIGYEIVDVEDAP